MIQLTPGRGTYEQSTQAKWRPIYLFVRDGNLSARAARDSTQKKSEPTPPSSRLRDTKPHFGEPTQAWAGPFKFYKKEKKN